MSFRLPRNRKILDEVIGKFTHRYGIRVVSYANVGNHLHFQIKISNRAMYFKFIRAVTGSIAVKIGRATRWNQELNQETNRETGRERFWDFRPFTRALSSYREYLNLRDYIQMNVWEGENRGRSAGRILIRRKRELENFFAELRSFAMGPPQHIF